MFKVEILENAQNYPFSEILSQMDLENSLKPLGPPYLVLNIISWLDG